MEQAIASKARTRVSGNLEAEINLEKVNLITILPLVGVAIGWLLSEAASLLRARRERRKVVGKVILRLLEIREMVQEELRRIALAKEQIERTGIITPTIRRLLTHLNPWRINESLKDSDELLLEIATVDPFLAFEVEILFASLVNLIPHAGAYVVEWEKQEKLQKFWESTFVMSESVTFLTFSDSLSNIIRKLARKKSIPSLFRAWRYFRAEKKKKKKMTTEEYATLIADVAVRAESLEEEFKTEPLKEN